MRLFGLGKERRGEKKGMINYDIVTDIIDQS